MGHPGVEDAHLVLGASDDLADRGVKGLGGGALVLRTLGQHREDLGRERFGRAPRVVEDVLKEGSGVGLLNRRDALALVLGLDLEGGGELEL